MEVLRLKLIIDNKSYHLNSDKLTPSNWRIGEYIDWTELDDENLVKSIEKLTSSKVFEIRTLVRSKCKKRKVDTICIIAEMSDPLSEVNLLMR